MSSDVDIRLPRAAGSRLQGDLTEAEKEHLTYLRTVQTITPVRSRRDADSGSKERAKLISTTTYNLKARQELQAQLKKEKDRAKAEQSDRGSPNSQEDASKAGKKTTAAEMMKKKAGSSQKKR